MGIDGRCSSEFIVFYSIRQLFYRRRGVGRACAPEYGEIEEGVSHRGRFGQKGGICANCWIGQLGGICANDRGPSWGYTAAAPRSGPLLFLLSGAAGEVYQLGVPHSLAHWGSN